ncbi:piggyBac transposable element-derived protein 4-like isoform X1 [Vespula squamosa]|uniref:PiggyBac transposable element-derived protein 4-like isoform X1 n=1 Tax=Vespula squamosa TaxID=30214 RepID=A0ABD2A172_VESSQ
MNERKKMSKWHDITLAEMKKFLGIIIMMGQYYTHSNTLSTSILVPTSRTPKFDSPQRLSGDMKKHKVNRILGSGEKTDTYDVRVKFALLVKKNETQNIIERKQNSDEEVASFTRKIRNKISLSSNSDKEDAYESKNLEEMLDELAIEEVELINTVGSLDNIQWNEFTNKQKSFTFIRKNRLLMELSSDIAPGEVLLFLNEKVLSLVHILIHSYQKMFSLGPDIVIDETIVPWRGK